MAQSSAPRRRNKPIMLYLLIASSVGLMAAQLRFSKEQAPTAGRWTLAIFTPLFQGGSWAARQFSSAADWALSGQIAQQENIQLRRENVELQTQISMLREKIAKLEREGRLSAFPVPEPGLVFWYADVISLSSQRGVRSLVVDKGKVDGMRPGMPAIDFSGGVVGLVVEVTPRSSVVRLLIDSGYSIGAEIQSTREQGMVEGDGRGRLRFKPKEAQKSLEIGMELISSGFEGSPYPKGLKIGTISEYKQDAYGVTVAEVKPAAEFARIEEVFLLDTEPASRSTALAMRAAPGDRITSASIGAPESRPAPLLFEPVPTATPASTARKGRQQDAEPNIFRPDDPEGSGTQAGREGGSAP